MVLMIILSCGDDGDVDDDDYDDDDHVMTTLTCGGGEVFAEISCFQRLQQILIRIIFVL